MILFEVVVDIFFECKKFLAFKQIFGNGKNVLRTKQYRAVKKFLLSVAHAVHGQFNWIQLITILENVWMHINYRSFLPSNFYNQWMSEWISELHTGHCKTMNFHTYSQPRTHKRVCIATQFRWPFYYLVVRSAHASTHTTSSLWKTHALHFYTIHTKWLRRIQVQTKRNEKNSFGRSKNRMRFVIEFNNHDRLK